MSNFTKHPPVPPLLIIAIGILAVSTASIFIRYAQEYAGSLAIAAFRLTIASLVLAPPALLNKRQELRSLQPPQLLLALLSGLFLALHFITWITSLEYTSVASSVVLVSTAPLFVAVLAPLALKEPLARLAVWGLVLALVGGIVVGLSDTCRLDGFTIACPPLADFVRGQAFLGDLLALAGAVTAAGYVLIGRKLRSKLSLISYIFTVYSVAAALLIGVMFAFGEVPWGYPFQAYIWFALLALVPQLIGHSSFNWALGYLSAAFVSITLLGEPIGSTILAYVLLGETPSSLKIFGAILIFIGILVASRSEHA
jgi:drug/metabolite transporter (DMT)-like permease